MRIDDCDYKKLVIAAFQKRQRDSEQPQLATFTRASIKQECLNVYDERKSKGRKIESKTLQDFFGVPRNENWRRLIEEFPLDKFRPLENLMKGKIQNPDMANIELLAWLIDFKHRPFNFDKDVWLSEEERAIIEIKTPIGNPGTSDPPGNVTNSVQATSVDGNRNSLWVKIAAVILLGLGLAGGTAFLQKKEKNKNDHVKSLEQKPDSLNNPEHNAQPLGVYDSDKTNNDNVVGEKSTRCQALTKKGTRCKRRAGSGKFCWQHG